MRAYVYKLLPTGGIHLGSGYVTGEYKTKKNLIRYGVRPYIRSETGVRIELHYDWNNRYGEPSEVIILPKC
jgi:hypothetical protein